MSIRIRKNVLDTLLVHPIMGSLANRPFSILRRILVALIELPFMKFVSEKGRTHSIPSIIGISQSIMTQSKEPSSICLIASSPSAARNTLWPFWLNCRCSIFLLMLLSSTNSTCKGLVGVVSVLDGKTAVASLGTLPFGVFPEVCFARMKKLKVVPSPSLDTNPIFPFIRRQSRRAARKY